MGHHEVMSATVSPKEGAELLGSNEKAVTAWIQRGESPFFTIELSPRRKLYRAYAEDLERVRPWLPQCLGDGGNCDRIALGPSQACQEHVAEVTQTGAKRSREAREKMAAAKRGTTRPQETRDQISATLRRQREPQRKGQYVTCPGCQKTRYRSPSAADEQWHRHCYVRSLEGQASLERAQTARRALIDAELRDLRVQGKVTTRELAGRLLVSRPVVTAHYIAAGLLPAEPQPSRAGGTRLVIEDTEVRRFLREWALEVKKGNARREAWLDEDFVVSQMRSRGLVAKLAAGPLTEVDVEDALRKRVRARRRAILPSGGGRPPSPSVPAHHIAWSRQLDAIEAELWEEYERDVNLRIAPGRAPTRWDAARELGHRLEPQHPERGTRKVWKADKRVKSLQIASN